VAVWRATRRRRLHDDVVFIGVTGSAGKTTAKELIAAVLSSAFRGQKNRGSRNDVYEVARTILAVRRGDRFCVQEIAAGRPRPGGSLPESVALLRPHIGVVTNVGHDHRSVFRTLESTANAKSTLIAAVPPGGTAILNADDPLVLAMRSKAAGRVITFGIAPDAMVRAEDVRSAWPERLTFTLRYEDQVLRVQTQLCGTHWVSAVLAAIAAGLAMQVPLAAAVEAVASTHPAVGRMSAVTHPDGVTFIRDDWKASVATVESALRFMEQARAPRKIVVIGTLSDSPGHSTGTYSRVARRAMAVADHVVFVGPHAQSALRAQRARDDDRLRAFITITAAVEYLQEFWRPGDLVLLKGSAQADHLARIALVRATHVQCWLARCDRRILCDQCGLLRVPGGAAPAFAIPAPAAPAPAMHGGDMPPHEPPPGERSAAGGVPRQVVVGLGVTRDDVGHRVLDRLAEALGREWAREGEVSIAHAECAGQPVCLVKLSAPVGVVGPAVMRLTRSLGVGPDGLVLVHGDMDLPVGVVRTRMHGSAGRHRHVRSVLETFQTDAIRRIKVGIAALSDGDAATMDRACGVASERALSLLVRPTSAGSAPARSTRNPARRS
jgi:UDP-N-acetylmuramyl pentapeptide synthase/peptidyl-tRNA hydrolase